MSLIANTVEPAGRIAILDKRGEIWREARVELAAMAAARYNQVMEPTAELIEALEQGKIDSARRMSFAEKFMAGAELFDYACSISLSGIRSQNSTFTEEQVQAELRRRIEIGRRIGEQR